MSGTPPLVASGVGFSYGERVVLRGMDLEAGLGEMVGLVGPNGSGKTTFLRIVSGTLASDTGTVRVAGKELTSLRASERGRMVGMVQQSPAIPQGLTALQTVLMGRNPHLGLLQWEGPRDIEICKRVMTMTETWEFAHRPVSSLSGGELQRIFIARALAQETPVLILDEPTAHLDISYQTGIFDMIDKVRRSTDLTVLVAMHDLTLAAQYCDRIAALHQGGIFACGEPSEVMTMEIVSTVFGASVSIVEHPVDGTPVVLPVRGTPGEGRDQDVDH